MLQSTKVYIQNNVLRPPPCTLFYTIFSTSAQNRQLKCTKNMSIRLLEHIRNSSETFPFHKKPEHQFWRVYFHTCQGQLVGCDHFPGKFPRLRYQNHWNRSRSRNNLCPNLTDHFLPPENSFFCDKIEVEAGRKCMDVAEIQDRNVLRLSKRNDQYELVFSSILMSLYI